MTRLFLRFYFGVIIILVAAWFVQAYVYHQSRVEQNIGVIERALSGGARMARDELARAGPENWQASLAEIQQRFEYPVQIVPRKERPMRAATRERLKRGEAILYYDRIEIMMPGGDQLLEFGPLPAFSAPSRTEIWIALGAVFLLTALAIAILLRPVVTQLRAVERTALAIAGGDLSARIASEKRRRKFPIAGAFDSMASRIEKLLRSQRELLQAVSHELRTPLARIKFATELLRSARDESHRQQRIDSIDEATDQLEELVGELLSYVRLDAEVSPTDPEEVCLDEVIEQAIHNHSPLFPNTEFTTESDSPGVRVVTDQRALLRAVGNLVSNAAKYSDHKVHVTVRREQDGAVISVDDDGPGIAPEDRDEVFVPFKRLSGNNSSGAGLGLALVHRIVRRLGGDVQVGESSLGGARFQLAIPSAPAS